MSESGFAMLPTREIAGRAKAASRVLASRSEAERNAVLQVMADRVATAADALFAANAEDLRLAEARTGEQRLSAATLSRLKLTPGKLREMVDGIRSVGALPDPLGRVLEATELDDRGPKSVAGKSLQGKSIDVDRNAGLHLQKLSVPLGVLAVIFEARPDAVTQIASLAVKSGNAVLLKPGSEVEHTAVALVEVLRGAVAEQGLPADAIGLVLGRERAAEVLGLHDLVDMVIPRGSKALVEYVQANTRIPVLGHAEGVCHIYVDSAADQAMALRVIADAKLDYPAACNAVETVLVHRSIAEEFLPRLAEDLAKRGVVMHAEKGVREQMRADASDVKDWHHEYGEAEMAVGVVDSLDQAVEHIHRHGSLHTESIITEDAAAAERFLRDVDAAGVFWNASTRFADGFRYGFGAEVGISTSKFHARGPVGLDGLTTYKYVLRGQGHVAGDYRGEHGRAFTHKKEQPR